MRTIFKVIKRNLNFTPFLRVLFFNKFFTHKLFIWSSIFTDMICHFLIFRYLPPNLINTLCLRFWFKEVHANHTSDHSILLKSHNYWCNLGEHWTISSNLKDKKTNINIAYTLKSLKMACEFLLQASQFRAPHYNLSSLSLSLSGISNMFKYTNTYRHGKRIDPPMTQIANQK